MDQRLSTDFRARSSQGKRGIAALTFVLVLAIAALLVGTGIVFTLTRQTFEERQVVHAEQALATAEAGAEEALLRFRRGETVPSPLTLTVGSGTATVTHSSAGNMTTIISSGTVDNTTRAIEITMRKDATDIAFFYGIQVDDGGMSMANASQVVGNVYSNGSIVGSGGQEPTISGSATVAGGIPANPQVQWTTENSNQFFATAASNEDIAQSFTATATGAVPQISVYLAKVGSPSKDITLELHADNAAAGKPQTSSLASATIYRSSVGTTSSWIDIAFSSPANVVNNTKYWIVLNYQGNNGTNYWNWRKDNSDGYTSNTGKYTSNCCSGNPSWTPVGGDLAFKVWIGGTLTKIEGVEIGDATSGDGYANLFDDVEIRGSDCPNAYCHVQNPARENLPISDGVIQDWRNAAAAGDPCEPPICDADGNYTLDDATASLGPIFIPGNMIIDNHSELTITGTIWVQGTIRLDNGCVIKLDSSYGDQSGVLLTDSTAVVNPGCEFQGSGTAGSYPMLLSAKNDPSNTVIQIDNTSKGMIYYAAHGKILFKQNAAAREATAYGLTLENGATVEYEDGLASLNFSSGPGGGYTTLSWREIVPP